jgi:2-amino-4-hydroxy-6-hydroxymethyldihydropteridine diphosphokinase
VREERWGARTLDLDLLLAGDLLIADDVLTVPHPHLCERAFVLAPLVCIAAHTLIPGRGVTVASAWRAVEQGGVRLYARGDVPAPLASDLGALQGS